MVQIGLILFRFILYSIRTHFIIILRLHYLDVDQGINSNNRSICYIDLFVFTLYPAYFTCLVTVGFLFNKTTLTLYFLVLNVLLLYLSLGFAIDVLLHRITLTLPLLHWFQLRLLLVNWEYLLDSVSGIMLVIIALISINVNVYSVDLLDYDTHQEQFIWLLAIFAIWITVFVMSNNLIILFFCWELVGLCSYLLISFWKERQHSLKCSFKAILYNKVGDIGLLLSFGTTLEVIRTIDLVPGITVLP